MKHRLDGAMFYLAGPMDDVEDRGVGWRREISKFLWKRNIGVLSPSNKAVIGAESEDEEYYSKINYYKNQGLSKEVHDKMSMIVADDYRMVDKADAIILYIDKNAHMCGSYHESGLAAYQRKPVIVCCPSGINEIPNWLWGIGRVEMFFEYWGEVKAYIEYICKSADPETYNRWRFFDYDKIFGKNI